MPDLIVGCKNQKQFRLRRAGPQGRWAEVRLRESEWRTLSHSAVTRCDTMAIELDIPSKEKNNRIFFQKKSLA